MSTTPTTSGPDSEALADLAGVMATNKEALFRSVMEVLAAEALPFPIAAPGAPIDPRAAALLDAVAQTGRGQWVAWNELTSRLGEEVGTEAAALPGWFALSARCTAAVLTPLTKALVAEPDRLAAAQGALLALAAQLNAAVTGAALRRQQEGGESGRIRKAEEALRAGELRLARLFSSGLLCTLVCDLIGNIKDANDAFLALVGYSREELLSGRIRWAEMTPPEWRHLDQDAVAQLKATGIARPWEKEYVRKDGSRVPILVGVAMLNDAECIAFALDITERRRLEEFRARALDLEAQNARITEASRLKSEFLANMSHELRTPLNSIIGFADLLHDDEIPSTAPEHREYLGDILKSARHLLQLINDVLDLAKVEAGKMDFRPEPVDLEEMARETWVILRAIALQKRITTAVEIDPSVRRVVVDPARLKQVLYNYTSNALKFTPEGGKVTIRARPRGPDEFRIEVEDDGVGIAAEDLGRLFVEFQQLDAGMAKRHQGTGLGLALTKRIVEAQGGSVGVDSTPGEGSTFHAVLPRQSLAATSSDPDPEQTFAPRPGARAATVLVVEDDTHDRRVLVQLLGKAGFAVEASVSGMDAIATCRSRIFDAITLDLLLPDITGLEVLHHLRKEGLNRQTPVLVVSVVAERGIVGGYAVHDYLRKPIDSAEVLASLARAGVAPEKSGTILVVDDDPDALKLMDATLRRLGYSIDCRLDAQDALAAAAASTPSVVILDLLMPGVDGFEFLARFRQAPRNRDVPVIVWTTKDLTSQDHARLRHLAQTVVAKEGGCPASVVEQLRAFLGGPSTEERQAR